ncbi:magnesium transporter [Antricoccus suffuscus]|uniref:Magnesium transporter n=1 Tax=Antricoccus suffuscus TaxID=1629062 RepID=A0A2T1A0A5_9ACTN|nr:magnesium and cobalt transport protein CorA [Antricoccus suffuscus]PRZ41917.1 magnesium transporter [Antricoccus suffuscus]
MAAREPSSQHQAPSRHRIPLSIPRNIPNPAALVRRKSSATRTGPEIAGPAHDPIVRCAVYAKGKIISHDAPFREASRIAKECDGFVWMGLHEPTALEFEAIADEFGLHPLAVEDAVMAHQRPKLERYDDTLFLVLKTCRYVEHETLTASSEVIATSEVMVFLGANFVITVRHGDFGELGDMRRRLEHDDNGLLELGPAAIMYAVADTVVDRYLEVANDVEIDLDELEESVFAPNRTQEPSRIYQLKRELLELKRAVSPLAIPLQTLSNRSLPLVPEPIREYFRDVEDHLSRVRDTVSGLDELLSSILQASIARLSLSENEDMRKITSWAGIR